MAIASFLHAGKKRRVLTIAAVAFALFSVSDLIEIETGSWWEPWWLLVLKIACVAILILALRTWLSITKAQGITAHPHRPEVRQSQST